MNNDYLLDTHILLWWLSGDKKLSAELKDLIEDPDNSISVSVASMWEIALKSSLNKLHIPENLKEVLEVSSIEFLSITVDHVLHVKQLPPIHSDPFDRLLVAQCEIEDLILITADKIIPRYTIKCV